MRALTLWQEHKVAVDMTICFVALLTLNAKQKTG